MHIKRFLEWIHLKQKLHLGHSKIPGVHEGEIWWASLGENIGFEINGKSKLFTRPVIVLRKLANGFYFVIPITSQIRKGTWYVNFKQRGMEMSACIQQSRAIDYRRLYSRLGELDDMDFKDIRDGFHRLYC